MINVICEQSLIIIICEESLIIANIEIFEHWNIREISTKCNSAERSIEIFLPEHSAMHSVASLILML